MRRIRAAVSLVVVLAVLLSGCSGGAGKRKDEPTGNSGRFPMTVSDCGRKVVLKKRPQRVLTIGSTASTLMWAAGASDHITTRATEGGAPLGAATKKLKRIPQISPNDDLSKKAIIGQSPDLVISAGLNQTTAQDLEDAGIKSIVNSGSCDGDGSGKNPDGDVDFDDVISDVRLYSNIFGTQGAAKTKIGDMRTRINTVKNTRRDRDQVKSAAAVMVDGSKISAYGRTSMTHAQLRTLGTKDVFGDLDERSNEVSSETFVDRNPDVVIVVYSGLGVAAKTQRQAIHDLRGLPGADHVSAIKHDRIIPLQAPYLTPSPLSVDGMEKMAAEIELEQ